MALTIGKGRGPISIGKGLNQALQMMMQNKVRQQEQQQEALQRESLLQHERTWQREAMEEHLQQDKLFQYLDQLRQQQQGEGIDDQEGQLGQLLQQQGQINKPGYDYADEQQFSEDEFEDPYAIPPELAERMSKLPPAQKLRLAWQLGEWDKPGARNLDYPEDREENQQLDIPALTKQIQERVSQLSPEDKKALKKEISKARKDYSSQQKSSKKRRQTRKSSKKLTTKVVDEFLRKAGGDADKARALARKDGFYLKG